MFFARASRLFAAKRPKMFGQLPAFIRVSLISSADFDCLVIVL
jgi:hypothetical protein